VCVSASVLCNLTWQFVNNFIRPEMFRLPNKGKIASRAVNTEESVSVGGIIYAQTKCIMFGTQGF